MQDEDDESWREEDRQNAEYHNEEGRQLMEKHAYEDAISAFKRALDHQPSYSSAHFNLAVAYAATGRRKEAIHHFAQAIELKSEGFPEAHVNRAALLYMEGRHSEALEHCEKALEEKPSYARAYYNLNTIYRAMGQQEKAISLSWKQIMSLCDDVQPDMKFPNTRHEPGPLSVVCVKWGKKYDSEYVNKLFRGVSKYLCAVPFTFYCLTDNPNGLEPDIQTRQLMPGFSGWWNKAHLFAPHHRWHGQILYLDLDSVITGSLDDFAKYSGSFAILKTDGMQNERRSQGVNSSIMMWNSSAAEDLEVIYTFLKANYKAVNSCIYKFDHWLEMLLPSDYHTLQDMELLQGQIVEYAASCQVECPSNARIVCFPLEPKPHNAPAPWVAEHWI
ncbi:unnamed protein product [Aphanomyces euteiches]|uniref:Uncharacterized protein n=1 Tax=Aphanomyces euteiches TaxID=100861 RepID=A0A6G0W623_9STRA|nr:hypothetical protein Ae201684_018365 [Aphanomyces euteiches]